MTFKEKIDKILTTNTLGIDSPTELEQKIGAGSGSVLKYYNKNLFPGPKTVRKITEGIGISRDWWSRGVGEIYLKPPSDKVASHEKFLEKSIEEEAISQELWQEIKETNKYFQKELDRAWDLINRIIPPSQASKRVTANNRK